MGIDNRNQRQKRPFNEGGRIGRGVGRNKGFTGGKLGGVFETTNDPTPGKV